MSTSFQLDLATALEISVNDPLIESKINALKNLHAKKIKSLMGIIDQSKKDMDKMKTLTKDNNRTKMIQILKNKQRDLELIIDILKQQFVESKCSGAGPRLGVYNEEGKAILDNLNDVIVSKTVAKGPKRFRPQSREEMELKISELERKLAKLTSSSTEAKSIRSLPSKLPLAPKTPQKSSQSKSSSNLNTTMADDSVKDASSNIEFQQLVAKLQTQRDAMGQLREEITRLRERNTELRLYGEESMIKDRQIEEVREVNNRLQEELLDLTQRLAISREEVTQLSMETDRDRLEQQREFSDLQKQCEQLLRQNSTLIKRMTDVEREAATRTGKLPASLLDTGAQDRRRVESLEQDLEEATDRLSSAQEEMKSLQSMHAIEINKLKDVVREGKVQLRDVLKTNKQLEEQISIRDADALKAAPAGRAVPTSATTASKAVANVQENATSALIKYTKKAVQTLLSKGLVVAPQPALHGALESLLKAAPGSSQQDLAQLIVLLEELAEASHTKDLDVLELSKDSRDERK